MAVKRKPIRLYDSDFNLLAEIDDYESLQFTRRFYAVGEFELRINSYKRHVELLQKNIFIMLGNQFNKVGIIKHRAIDLDENGKSSETWVISGTTLKGVMGQRLIVPPAALAYDSINDVAEAVMKHYIDANVINPADASRKIDQVSNAANANRGSSVKWQSRFANLADDLTQIATVTETGWEVLFDAAARSWIFDVVIGINRTINQSVNPPVIFSPDFRNVKKQSYSDSNLNYKNVGYIAGQGEGEDRRVIVVGLGTGFDRIEAFIDARDIEETREDETPIPEAEIVQNLTFRGNQKMLEFASEEFMEAEIFVPELATNNMQYEIDWDLGDIVTVQNRKWAVTLDTRITEVKEIYESNGFQLSVIFGNNRPTLISIIKQRFDQLEGEVKK